jgi:hypothetical protein
MIETEQLAILTKELRTRRGARQAITIAAIAERLGLSRRSAETFLEIHLADLPFCVVSGATGYYRPAGADDINHYRAALHSRIRCLALRSKTVARAAAAEHYHRQGKLFLEPHSERDTGQFLFPLFPLNTAVTGVERPEKAGVS